MSTTYRPIITRVLVKWMLLVLSLLSAQSWAATPMVSAGGNHSCAVLSSGAVQCWGLNTKGQLGNGSTINSNIPVYVSGISNATSVSAQGDSSCAVIGSGAIQCWGANNFGQLGNGSTTNSNIPLSVSGISNATSISTGSTGGHFCAVLSSGAVQCWGYNSYGQLGNGSITNSNSPVSVSGISNAISVSAGSFHSCAVLAGGAIKCWGFSTLGQLGNGSITNSNSPVNVVGISNATSVSAGYLSVVK